MKPLLVVSQYDEDYYTNKERYSKLSNKFGRYIISSDHESISDSEGLLGFLENCKKSKLILVTHTSFKGLCDILKANKVVVDTLIIDEAHHFGSKKHIEYLESLDNVEFVFGFTATPSTAALRNYVKSRDRLMMYFLQHVEVL
jgi:hypothetical protein